ncbi:MAG: DNA alkylation repair protein [Verrucomicrobia bacterium]|nr:DNA alkylation repair protein [Verrucomicrobiota bacterium]
MAEALKHWFDRARFEALADLFAAASRGFDRRLFLARATDGLEPLALLARMRRGTEALRAALPGDYVATLPVLRAVAPRIGHSFVGMLLPDYVGLYGREHPRESLEALRYLTRYSSGEFAVREFLRRDLEGTLAVMTRWAEDEDEHVRRLASEGCRPRLPWSFRLEALVADPAPVAPILDRLQADPSLYVRKSVANHLNDISKDHPEWMLTRLRGWGLEDPRTAWIAKRAARTLIKAGHPAALALFRFGAKPAVRMGALTLAKRRLRLGEALEFSFPMTSTSARSQRLVVDYVVHYVKRSGGRTPKVFKLAEVELAPRAQVMLRKRQVIRDFSTRKHHAGRHRVEVQINGSVLAGAEFWLAV